jgi:hypothetical protein
MNNMTPTPFIGGTTPNFDTLTIDNWISGANGGPLTLLSWPVGPMDATPVSWVEDVLNGFVPTISSALPPSPAPGKLWFNSLDGQLYIWYNDPNSSQWVIANNTGIQDAPIGTVTYGRQNRTWVPALALSGGIMTGPLVLHNDPTAYFMAATKGYVDLAVQAYLPLTGGTITGQLTLSLEPVVAHQAANKAYVDLHSGTVIVSDVAPSNPIPGQLWFDSTGVQLYIWYLDGAGVWAQVGAPAFTAGTSGGGAGGAFPEAPVDGRIYGRNGQLQSWAPVLPILGGQMAGPIILVNSSPILDNEAASKRYVEDIVASSSLWQGNYIIATNTPDLLTFTPLLNGYSWTTITQDPAQPELLTVPLPGIPLGTLMYNGDLLRYEAGTATWYQLRGSGLTKVEADATFVFRAGDAMTGALSLVADPVLPLEAATMQYVEAQRVVISSLPPANPFEGQLWYDLGNPNLYVWVVDPTSAQWVIAVNPGASSAALPFGDTRAPPFEFPPNPVDGEEVSTPAGATYRWNNAANRWDYVPAQENFVNISGDTMTGWLTIEGMDNAAVKFQKLSIGPSLDEQWGIGADYSGLALGGVGFKIVRFDSNGQYVDSPISIAPIDSTISIGGAGIQMNNSLLVGLPIPTMPTQAVNKTYADTKVDKSGDTMTGPLVISASGGNATVRISEGSPGGSGSGLIIDHSPNTYGVIIFERDGITNFLLGDNTATAPNSFILSSTGVDYLFRVQDGSTDFEVHNIIGETFTTTAGDPVNVNDLTRKAYVDRLFSQLTGPITIGNMTPNTVGLTLSNSSVCRHAFEIQNASSWPAIVINSSGGGAAVQITGGDLNFDISAGQHSKIVWPGSGPVGPPTFTNRSVGTRLVLYSSVTSTSVDFGLGIDGGALWYSASNNTGNHRWYGGTTLYATLNNNGMYVNGRSQIQATSQPSNNYTNGVLSFTLNNGGALCEIRPFWTGYQGYGGTECYMYLFSGNGGYGWNWWIRSQTGPATYVNGNIYAANFNQVSDASTKQDIAEIDPDQISAAFNAFKPVKFRLKPPTQPNPHGPGEVTLPSPNPDKIYYGLVADDVERGIPDAVTLADYTRHHDFDGNEIENPKPNIIKAYDMAAVLAIAIAKIKQLEARLDGIH